MLHMLYIGHMTRVLKRVPLQFNWPIHKVWCGYVRSGSSRRDKQRWQATEPPAGPGFQLWETTSEGSPVSPVFTTLDRLCTWAATHATTFGDARATKDQWKKMLLQERVE